MARKPTTPEAVLAACKTQLRTYCGVSFPSDACVWLTLQDDDEVASAPPHDRFVTLRPLSFRPDNPVVTGAGADLFVSGSAGGTAKLVPLSMPLEVSLWVRLTTDSTGRDDAFLTDASLGVLVLWRRVLGGLQMFDPVSGPDKILTYPMRLADPGTAFLARRRQVREFGKLESVFDVRFVCELPSAEV